ncbi:hypothetical protein NQZ68_026004 [Dissostichus eleginoides]|nr:hypothetical protein NQZ68_026004 [Dissostichus eleginoides]
MGQSSRRLQELGLKLRYENSSKGSPLIDVTGPVLPLGIHNPTAAHGRPCMYSITGVQRFNGPRVESAPRPIRTAIWPSPGGLAFTVQATAVVGTNGFRSS